MVDLATMRNPDRWEEPAQDNLAVAAMDVTSEASIESAVQQIIDTDGHIDVLINNAGYGVAGCLETVTIEEAKSIFDVNVWGVVRVLHAVLPHMRRGFSGHVINLSSTSGIRGVPCLEFYTGSKFALEGMHLGRLFRDKICIEGLCPFLLFCGLDLIYVCVVCYIIYDKVYPIACGTRWHRTIFLLPMLTRALCERRSRIALGIRSRGARGRDRYKTSMDTWRP
jgi:short chain dehydrogenase